MSIPKTLRNDISADPYYLKCCRATTWACRGRITLEHVWIYGGRQIQEKWAIIPLCEFHHSVNNYQDNGDLNKQENKRISLARATPEDLAKYPKKDFKKEIYG